MLPVRLHIEIRKSDLVAFYKYLFWLSPEKSSFRIRRRIQNALGFACVPVAIVFLCGAPFSASLGWNLLFFSSLLFVMGYHLADKFVLASAEKGVMELLGAGKNQDLMGPMSIDLEDEVFVWRTQNSETKMNKNAVEKFGQTRLHYFIFTSAMSGYVIPKRSLSKGEQTDFETWWGIIHAPES